MMELICENNQRLTSQSAKEHVAVERRDNVFLDTALNNLCTQTAIRFLKKIERIY